MKYVDQVIGSLQAAEDDLQLYAELLADEGHDSAAAEALRLKNTILKFRMDLRPNREAA